MKSPLGILLDERLVKEKCENRIKTPYNKLFSYLGRNPNVGLITRMSKENIERDYRRMTNRSPVYEFDEMLERLVKIESIEYQTFQENLKNVSNLFRDMSGHTSYFVPNRYARLVRCNSGPDKIRPGFNKRRLFLSRHDFKGLAEAVSLKPKYQKLLFASNSTVLSHPFVLNSMEENFDVTCGDPEIILSEARKQIFI